MAVLSCCCNGAPPDRRRSDGAAWQTAGACTGLQWGSAGSAEIRPRPQPKPRIIAGAAMRLRRIGGDQLTKLRDAAEAASAAMRLRRIGGDQLNNYVVCEWRAELQ